MNSSKKISWQLAAVTAAAALLSAGTALADGRGHDHGGGYGDRGHYDRGDYHHWNAPHMRHYSWAPPRRYWREERRHHHHGYYGYYGYRPSYYYPSYYSSYVPGYYRESVWPDTAVGARLSIDIR